MSERRGGWGKGCSIAIAIFAGVVLVCGGVLTWAGYSVWNDPNVQRGVAIAGAAMDMAQEAMQQPGAAELRAAGCGQAMVLTPELRRRFLATVAPDGGYDTPELTLVLCVVPRGAADAPSCEDAVRAYATVHSPPPAEVAASVSVQGEEAVRCEGIYGSDGAFLREIDPELRATFGRMATPSAPPPSP